MLCLVRFAGGEKEQRDAALFDQPRVVLYALGSGGGIDCERRNTVAALIKSECVSSAPAVGVCLGQQVTAA